jgi:phosphatidate phosphatase APP1
VFITDGPETGISAAGQVLITPANASLGIISDIDDTVLQTGAESLLTMARLTFLRNARTRLPFEGAAAFYNALHQGVDQREANPLFFVSSSPWNLYDFLIDFLEFHQFPKAPILLRDLGIDANKFIGEKHSVHKAERIRRILSTYPDLPFVLIGDNGQEDGEIYRSIIHEFPGRIAAVYIRDVSLEKEKKGLIDSIGIEMEERGVPFLRVADSYAAAEHAESLGLIASSDLERVKTAMMQRINPLMMGPGNRS